MVTLDEIIFASVTIAFIWTVYMVMEMRMGDRRND